MWNCSFKIVERNTFSSFESFVVSEWVRQLWSGWCVWSLESLSGTTQWQYELLLTFPLLQRKNTHPQFQNTWLLAPHFQWGTLSWKWDWVFGPWLVVCVCVCVSVCLSVCHWDCAILSIFLFDACFRSRTCFCTLLCFVQQVQRKQRKFNYFFYPIVIEFHPLPPNSSVVWCWCITSEKLPICVLCVFFCRVHKGIGSQPVVVCVAKYPGGESQQLVL